MSVAAREIPYVFHAEASSAGALSGFIAQRSSEVRARLATHGAVLFRSFEVPKEETFERAVLSIEEMRGMDSYFMSEAGRSLIAGTKFVFCTNAFRKTGGSWFLDGVHTENYYSADVPRFISFLCMKPSWIGGETGLVDMTQVYEDLDEAVKQRLDAKAYFARRIPLRSIVARYGVTADMVRSLCRHYGIAVVCPDANEEYVLLCKPSVFDHPLTKAPALTANLWLEVSGLPRELNALLRRQYTGWQWALHRFIWNHPRFVRFIASRGKARSPKVTPAPDPYDRIGSAFSVSDVKRLAASMQEHLHVFRWRRGDVLIVDNLQVAHTGMPGLGPRLLRVVLTNPLKMDLSMSGPGRQTPVDDPEHCSLGELLRQHSVSVG